MEWLSSVQGRGLRFWHRWGGEWTKERPEASWDSTANIYYLLEYSVDVKMYTFSHFNNSEIILPSMASYHYNRRQYFFLSGTQNNGGVVAKSFSTSCSPPGSSVHRTFPGKNIGVGCHFLVQGIFLTQGSNPYLLHCRRVLYHWVTKEA